MKTCSKCKISKDRSEFYIHTSKKDGLQSSCKVCRREFYINNRLRLKPRRRKYYLDHAEQHRAAHLKYCYGITPKDFDQMSEEQGGVCAICKQVAGGKGLHVDHDHKTGRVRGLLCYACNMAIGLLKDSAVFTRSATEYLEKHL